MSAPILHIRPTAVNSTSACRGRQAPAHPDPGQAAEVQPQMQDSRTRTQPPGDVGTGEGDAQRSAGNPESGQGPGAV